MRHRGDKIIWAAAARSGIRVDRAASPAQYRCIVRFRFAPEVRGTLGFDAVAALFGAVAVFYCADVELEADHRNSRITAKELTAA